MYVSVQGDSAYVYTGTRRFDRLRPTILFVHGAANDHSVWALQARYFAHHGSNAMAVDLPGHGRSGGSVRASIPAIADWLTALLDGLGIDRAVLVGHSMGALASLDMAARQPARVRALALLGPAAPMAVSDVLLDAAKAGDPLAYELMTGWSLSPRSHLGGNRQPGIWMTNSALRLMERSRPGVLHADLAACHGYADGLAAASATRCPVLLIFGQRDQMVPPKSAGPLLDALRGKRVVTLPECGHGMMAEAPDLVLDALREFIGNPT
ncbi:MAG TPA: alpha/beta fold hydrolase [Casimicrobiaceae bacterium]